MTKIEDSKDPHMESDLPRWWLAIRGSAAVLSPMAMTVVEAQRMAVIIPKCPPGGCTQWRLGGRASGRSNYTAMFGFRDRAPAVASQTILIYGSLADARREVARLQGAADVVLLRGRKR